MADQPQEPEVNADAANAGSPAEQDPNVLAPDELEALLAQAKGGDAAPAAAESAPSAAESGADPGAIDELTDEVKRTLGDPIPEVAPATAPIRNTFEQAELDALAAQVAQARGETYDPAQSAAAPPPRPAPAAVVESPPASAEPVVLGDVRVSVSPEAAQAFQPPELGGEGKPQSASAIDLLDDVELEVKVELGRTDMYIEDVLRLGAGAVVELDKLAGDPVDIFVNERLIARGEVLVLNENFCVRINEIHSPIPELEVQ